jgi:hypothetical protein
MLMNSNRIALLACASLILAVTANAASLPCVNPGTERWPVKICASPQPKTHQEQCILKSSLTSGSNLSVALNGQTRGTSS